MAFQHGVKGTGSERGAQKDLRFFKQCLECGQTYYKYVCCSQKRWAQSKFCSVACKGAYLKRAGICGRDFQIGHEMPTKGTGPKIPCRGCGIPVPARRLGRHHCGKPECAAKSKEIRYQKIGQALAMHSNCPRGEGAIALNSHLMQRGWIPEYTITVGGHTYRLDFARPEAKLYVEADGVSHFVRRAKDTERTRLLNEDGWIGLRFWNSEIRDNLQGVLQAIWN